MSDEEKALQMGLAAVADQAAKVALDLAYIEEKLRRVAAAYAAAAGVLSTRLGQFYEAQLVDGKLRFGLTGKTAEPADLLNEAGLNELLQERDKARLAVEETRNLLNSFGISCLN